MQNRERDDKKHKELLKMGWKVLVVWECELKKNSIDKTLSELVLKIKN